MHTASMPSITIRNVPPEVHAVLTARAARQGQSFQRYILELLTQASERPTMEEWLDEVDEVQRAWPGRDRRLTNEEIVAAIELGRTYRP